MPGATLSNFRQNRTDTASLPITGDQQTVSLQLLVAHYQMV